MTHNNERNPGRENEPLSPLAMRIAKFLGRFIPGRTKDRFAEDVRRARATGSFPDGSPVDPVTRAQQKAEAIYRQSNPITEELRAERRKNAQSALNFVHGLYRPEQTVERISEQMRDAGQPERTIGFFEGVYIGEANERLHSQPGPVIVAEMLRATFRNNGDTLCAHCNTMHFGDSTITAAENPKDIELTLDRYHGSAQPMAKIAKEPVGKAVRTIEFTALDMHTLISHPEHDAAVEVTNKIFSLEPFLAAEPPVLEQPRFGEYKTQPPQIV